MFPPHPSLLLCLPRPASGCWEGAQRQLSPEPPSQLCGHPRMLQIGQQDSGSNPCPATRPFSFHRSSPSLVCQKGEKRVELGIRSSQAQILALAFYYHANLDQVPYPITDQGFGLLTFGIQFATLEADLGNDRKLQIRLPQGMEKRQW